MARARACASTRRAPRSSSATGTPRCSPRSRSSAAAWSGSRPRSGTSSTPRSARSRSRSRRARRARRRCPTSATRSSRSAWRVSLACSAATPARRSRTSRCGTSATSATRSAERVILPDATILLDYLLQKIDGAHRDLVVRPRADAREHRARPRAPRVVARPAGAGRACRPLARGGLRDRPARVARGRGRAPPAARAARARAGRRHARSASPTSTPASTTRATCATSPRSSPGSTRWSRPKSHAAPEGDGRCSPLSRSSAPARSATCTTLGRGAAAARRVGPDPRVRRRPADADPRQGPRADRACRGSGSTETGDDRPEPPARRPAPDDLPADGLATADAAERAARPDRCSAAGRSVLPVEIVVRGYLSGSGWKEYRRTGAVCGVPLPAGLRESDRLPEPIFTPGDEGASSASTTRTSTSSRWSSCSPTGRRRATTGSARRRAGARRAVGDVALALYRHGAMRCAGAGIILADTKFEMGARRRRAASSSTRS